MDIKLFVTFIIGVAVGAFGTKLYLEDKYYTNEHTPLEEEETESEDEPSDSPIAEDLTSKDNIIYKTFVNKTRKYNKYTPPTTLCSEDDVPITLEGVINTDEPYLISEGDFGDSMESYDKLTLYYYDEDDCLTDDQEELIHNVESLINKDFLLSFGIGYDDPDVIYVRNEKMGADYEIIRLYKSYRESVLGIIDPPISTRRRKNIEDD